MDELVSIVIPCFNDGEYLQQAIDSALSQTYPYIEVIVVDDGSNDPQTIAVIKELEASEIQVLHTPHAGPACARNTAIEKAQGQYILPLDADDWIEARYIEKAVGILKEKPEIGIVYSRAELFGEKQGEWSLPEFDIGSMLVDNCIFATSLFRKRDWEDAGGFCTELKYGLEDYDFWLSLLEQGKQVHRLDDVCFHYRIKSASRSSGFAENWGRMNQTYQQIYHRHKRIYREYLDEFIPHMRQALIHERMRNNDYLSRASDPVGEYWQSIRLLKPGLAAKIERLFSAKDRIKEVLRCKRPR